MNAFETNDFFKNHSYLDSKSTTEPYTYNSIFLILLSGNFALESQLGSEPLLGG